MTVESFDTPEYYVISGIGPYPTGFPYADAAVTATVELADGEFVDLTTDDFGMVPEQAETAGDLFLTTGMVTGISPGFRVPPLDVVAKAEWLDPEPGNPGVFIRVLAHLMLYELSLVTRPAYEASQAELRSLRNLETRPAHRIFLP